MSHSRPFIERMGTALQKVTTSTPLAIIVAALILGGSHIVYGFAAAGGQGNKQVAYFSGKPIDGSDFVEGKQNADVFVVEYSDPECPYCVSLHPTMKRIRTEYADKIGFVYRHFPLTQIHPNAYDESKAIACAGILGGGNAFYQYIDKLYGYKSQSNQTQLPATGKEDIASHLGLSSDSFKACMSDTNTALIVDTALNDGTQAGVQGTPSSFVLAKTRKGYEIVAMIDGARQYEYVKAAIDQALAR